MSEQTRVSHPIYGLLPTEVEGFGPLAELALDLRWSWNHYADNVCLRRARNRFGKIPETYHLSPRSGAVLLARRTN